MTLSRLQSANLVLVVLLVLHVADHARQGEGVPVELSAVGTSGLGVAALSGWLAWRRHPLAADAAVAVGLGTAIGFVAVHVLAPTWFGSFAFSYPDRDLDVLSWTSLVASVIAALRLARVGLAARRERPALGSRAAAR